MVRSEIGLSFVLQDYKISAFLKTRAVQVALVEIQGIHFGFADGFTS